MRVRFRVEFEVNAEEWSAEYGMPVEEVEEDVRSYLANCTASVSEIEFKDVSVSPL